MLTHTHTHTHTHKHRNVGIQPLMNAIIKLLPSPLNTGKELKGINIKTGNIQIVDNIENENETLIASAFKVQHDFQRGSLVFFRVYRGKIKVKDVLLNTTLNEKDYG